MENLVLLMCKNGLLASGQHPFSQMEHAYMAINTSLANGLTGQAVNYALGSKFAFSYFHISARQLIEESKLPSGKLLLSIKYKLISTRDAAEVFNCRQLFQVGEDVFVFVEYGHGVAHEVKIDTQLADIENLEGLILRGSLDLILEEFMIWLVEVDPIGFELLRRMNRDGFIDNLSIHEELWPIHDSEDLMDKWFNEMTNYADAIELSNFVDTEELMFKLSLAHAVRNADSFTKSDFFERFERWNWVNPRLRESGFEE